MPSGAGQGSAESSTGERSTGTGESSTGMPTAESTSSSTGGESLPPGCVCRDPVPDDEAFTCEDLAQTTCEGDAICPTLLVWCPRSNPDMYACSREYQYDEDALACALAALRDRSPGKLLIDAANTNCGLEGCGHDEVEIAIVPDGHALVRSCYASPISAESSASNVSVLDEPAHFDGCSNLPSPAERYGCLFEGLLPGVEVCG